MTKIESFKDHPCLRRHYGVVDATGRSWADGGAAFGVDPEVTEWDIAHGSGAGLEDIYFRVPNADQLWQRAQKLVETRES